MPINYDKVQVLDAVAIVGDRWHCPNFQKSYKISKNYLALIVEHLTGLRRPGLGRRQIIDCPMLDDQQRHQYQHRFHVPEVPFVIAPEHQQPLPAWQPDPQQLFPPAFAAEQQQFLPAFAQEQQLFPQVQVQVAPHEAVLPVAPEAPQVPLLIAPEQQPDPQQEQQQFPPAIAPEQLFPPQGVQVQVAPYEAALPEVPVAPEAPEQQQPLPMHGWQLDPQQLFTPAFGESSLIAPEQQPFPSPAAFGAGSSFFASQSLLAAADIASSSSLTPQAPQAQLMNLRESLAEVINAGQDRVIELNMKLAQTASGYRTVHAAITEGQYIPPQTLAKLQALIEELRQLLHI